MKIPIFITLSIVLAMFNSECIAQLVAEAGSDTAVCADSPNTLSIGGNPTASGGVSPYRYTWSGTYEYAGRIYTASYMLEDTTVANPVFREGAIPDSVILYVTVTDQENEVASDSIQVYVSKYLICTGECRMDILMGDSVQLGPHCVSGGIPPHKYFWTPAESLSDATIQNPWAKPNETTSYNVTITDSIGCQATSGCFVFVNPASISDSPNNTEIVIYPNPVSKIFYLQFNSDDYYNTSFKLIDILGKIAIEMDVYTPEVAIDLQGLTPGAYIYLLDSPDKHLKSGTIVVEQYR